MTSSDSNPTTSTDTEPHPQRRVFRAKFNGTRGVAIEDTTRNEARYMFVEDNPSVSTYNAVGPFPESDTRLELGEQLVEPTAPWDRRVNAEGLRAFADAVDGQPYRYGGGEVGDNSGSVCRANMRPLPARMREAAETLREANCRALPDAVATREDLWSAGGLEDRAQQWEDEDAARDVARRDARNAARSAIVATLMDSNEYLEDGDDNLEAHEASAFADMVLDDPNIAGMIARYRETLEAYQ